MQSSHFMIVLIVAMALGAGVLKARYRSRHGIIDDKDINRKASQHLDQGHDTDRMREEIRILKERIQVLERIATDNNGANDISRQIEQLRNS